ncbi:hypothetical protein [Secundilactobacillus kimchicus]|uniref:hypothetical protein n=2 Tax=Secundilactobacillus kimchicus TaxID=528209 RepID=UPI0024A97A6C|nr:hypothetical protein [Secundilactobacillus kimchicus]
MNSKNVRTGRQPENKGTGKSRQERLAELRAKVKKQESAHPDDASEHSSQADGSQEKHQQQATIRQLRKKVKALDKKLAVERQNNQTTQQENFHLQGQLKTFRADYAKMEQEVEGLSETIVQTKTNLAEHYVHKTVLAEQVETAETKQRRQQMQITALKASNRTFRNQNRQLTHVNDETSKHLHVIREVLSRNHVTADLLNAQKVVQRQANELTELKTTLKKVEKKLHWYRQANGNLRHQYNRQHASHLTKRSGEELLDTVGDDVLDHYIRQNATLEQGINILRRRVTNQNADEVERLLEPVLTRLDQYYAAVSVKHARELVRLNEHQEKRKKKIALQQTVTDVKKDQLVYSTRTKKEKGLADSSKAQLNVSVNQELARQVLNGAKIVIIDWQKTYPITKALTSYGAEVVTFNDGNYHYKRLQTVLNREDIDLIAFNPSGMHHEVSLIIGDPTFKNHNRLLNLKQQSGVTETHLMKLFGG